MIPNSKAVIISLPNVYLPQEITYAPPSGSIEQLISIRFTLVTGAPVASRRVHLQLRSAAATGILLDLPSRSTTAANQKDNYQAYNIGFQPAETAPEVHIPIPELILTTPLQLTTSLKNAQTGDSYTNISILVMRSTT